MLTPVLFVLATLNPPADAVQWRLVFSDEFDGTSLDQTKWRAEDAALVKNEELQYYAPDHVSVRGGVMRILAEAKPRGGRKYTSGLIETRGLYSRAFGRFEARIQLPRTKGLWPAWWMLPANGEWPPEIDIMEALGHEPTKMYMSNHYGVWPGHKWKTTEFAGPDFSAGFHTYTADWFPDRIDFYVDGVKRATHTEGVTQTPFYLILNVAVGGHWPGNPDATTVFPQEMIVDYVRVYEPIEPGRAYLDLTSTRGGSVRPDPEAYAFDAGASVTLRAQADLGYRFARWEGVPDAPVKAEALLAMSENRTVRAVFEPDPDAPARLPIAAVTASSEERDDLAARLAVDGNDMTRWASKFSDPEWIAVDLGEKRDVTAMRIRWEHSYSAKYRVEVSDDGTTWKEAATRDDNRGGVDTVMLGMQARHIRITGLARRLQWGHSIWEIEVFGR